MPNIAITSYCNLHCPYCFAQQMMNENNINNISLEMFDKILEWIQPYVAETQNRTGIIGGEPTLHPQFEQIMEKISAFCYKNNSKSILFTNGIYLTENLFKFIPDNMRILINYNHPDYLTKENQAQLNNNLDFLYSIGWLPDKVTLGINLCEEINDYNYFKETIKKYNCYKFRMAVTYPVKGQDLNQYYLNMKNKFLEMIQFAIDMNLDKIDMDCKIPINYFNEEEQKLIYQIIPEEKYNESCHPEYEIFSNFTMSSCFAHYKVINCNRWNNFKEFKLGVSNE